MFKSLINPSEVGAVRYGLPIWASTRKTIAELKANYYVNNLNTIIRKTLNGKAK